MPCASNTFLSEPDVGISDLLELHAFTAGVEFQPRSKPELVAALAASAHGPRSLRALGTNYSLSDAAVAEDVVDTSSLQMHVCQPFPAATGRLDPGRLRDGGSDFLATVCSGDARAARRHFVHVEAGIKVHVLLADLAACGLALPTMGAGGGQSLAGALSTGTHGADFQVPPLVEWIRAVHLVGAGGQEWWITPEASIFADGRVLTLPDWCDDACIVANDDAFNAVRVGVGRFGVIYSMILEVIPAYGLLEVNLEHEWSEIRDQLANGRISNGSLTGIFDAVLTGLETGWFRNEVLNRTLEDEAGNYHYVQDPDHHVQPPDSPSKQKRYLEMLASMGLGDLAVDLRGDQARRLHHANIAVNLASFAPIPLSRPGQCWVTRRWAFQDGVRSVALEPTPRDPVVQAVIDNKRNPSGIVGPLQDQLEPDTLWGDLVLGLGLLFHDQEAERFEEFMNVDIPRIASESTTSGEALFMILYRLATDPTLEGDSKPAVIAAISKAIGGTFSKLVRSGPASGDLGKNVLDVHDYEIDGAQSGDSAEFFFDAESNDYLDFIDAVTDLASTYSPVFGYIGIRFTPSATASIAMQQFALTISVEVATARARQDDVYRQFWDEVHRAANERRGIPHWGQEFRQPTAEIAAHYGEGMGTWRRMLAELSIDQPSTFSTPFSRDSGLEPTEATGIFDCDAVDKYLVGLEG